MTAHGNESLPINLTIRLRQGPDGGEHEFRLVAADGRPAAGSTLPDPDAALAAVERFGEDIFFPKPGPPRLCTQQYGGPQTALVTGTFRGRTVAATFRRTDGCEIARWNAMAPLLGGTAGPAGRLGD
ncbi:hypothetical protein QFZ40_003462 [Arthrobacter pascens]|uniref:serine protease inhibitor n=1 Tax=Arthrobacter pascens TaxID=1677 RepID=UPI002783027A|nr:serine protease inhibitor [Arthrobacter pascens]MDQ0635553.1 hypothetical protein [Arthrobacter pascens]